MARERDSSPNAIDDAAPARVLLAEPDADVAKMLSLLLGKEGFAVTRAQSGPDTLVRAAESAYEVVLLDSDWAGEQWRRLDRLAELAGAAAIIISTNNPAGSHQLEALTHGAFATIVKPFAHLRLVVERIRVASRIATVKRSQAELLASLHTEIESRKGLESALESVQSRLSQLDVDVLSGTDSDTGLATEVRLLENLRRECARSKRYAHPMTVAIAQVDGLEHVLERYGAEVARRAFCAVAAVLPGTLREVDLIGRIGPDAFGFAFVETGRDGAEVAVRRLQADVAQVPALTAEDTQAAPVELSLSFGLSAFPGDGMDVTTLLDKARRALDAARQAGRNQMFGASGS